MTQTRLPTLNAIGNNKIDIVIRLDNEYYSIIHYRLVIYYSSLIHCRLMTHHIIYSIANYKTDYVAYYNITDFITYLILRINCRILRIN